MISLNPFKQLPIYTPEVLDLYRAKGSRGQKPHVFGIADDAFRQMNANNGVSQSAIISGESGAGKTEATKLFLRYITECSALDGAGGGGEENPLNDKLLELSPLMEAFGNAKTTRNDNSSLFGKWTEVSFKASHLVGGEVATYLLEKCRVVGQQDNERNYHVFCG